MLSKNQSHEPDEMRPSREDLSEDVDRAPIPCPESEKEHGKPDKKVKGKKRGILQFGGFFLAILGAALGYMKPLLGISVWMLGVVIIIWGLFA